MPHAIELGLDTFGDVTVGGDGRPLSHAQVLRNVVEQGLNLWAELLKQRPVTWRGHTRSPG